MISIPYNQKHRPREDTVKSDHERYYRDTYIRARYYSYIYTGCVVKKPTGYGQCARGLFAATLAANSPEILLRRLPVPKSAISDPSVTRAGVLVLPFHRSMTPRCPPCYPAFTLWLPRFMTLSIQISPLLLIIRLVPAYSFFSPPSNDHFTVSLSADWSRGYSLVRCLWMTFAECSLRSFRLVLPFQRRSWRLKSREMPRDTAGVDIPREREEFFHFERV